MSIQIQFQDNGTWLTTIVLDDTSNDQYVLHEMKNAKMAFRDKRIRAIDSEGRLVDMLA